MATEDIKSIIKQEFLKCASDPVYFMKKYYWIQHPQRGRVQFNLYQFQEAVLHLLKDNEYVIINKSRQLGISTLVSAYALWLMLFQRDKNILCIATKQDTAKNMVTKIRFAYEQLPKWLKLKATEDNKLSLRLSNGSQVKAVAAASDAGRSEAVSLLILDEAAFIDNINTIFTAAQQTLATGGQCFAVSTPNGTGNWFHKTFVAAQERAKDNKFLPLSLPWHVHPERDQKWRNEQDATLGVAEAAQECDCNFTTSGATVIEPDILNWYEATCIQEPFMKTGFDNNLWFWESPDYSRNYMIIADVARGDGSDFSTCHIVDIVDYKQVGEYKGQLGTREFGHFLVTLGTQFNDALLAIENTGIGWDVVQTAIEREYKNLYYSLKSDVNYNDFETYLSKYDKGDGLVPGFSMTSKTRPLVISKLKTSMQERVATYQSKRLQEELRVFIWKNGKPQAQTGYNDDLVIPWATGLFIRDTALSFMTKGHSLTKATLNSFTKTGYETPIYKPHQVTVNPWSIPNPYGGFEDITWLLK